jgi:hypothetical protein
MLNPSSGQLETEDDIGTQELLKKRSRALRSRMAVAAVKVIEGI